MKEFSKSLLAFLATPLALSDKGMLELESKLEALLHLEIKEELSSSYRPKTIEELSYNPDTKIGQIYVTGLLVDKYDAFLSWYLDATSYEELVSDVKTLLEAGAETIIQYNDSGGGQAYGMMESSSLVRKMLDEKSAKMVTYSDGLTASAAYGWASISDEIITNPDSELGSVGVVVSLTDYSKYLNELGIKKIYITAGEGKVPFNADGSFTDTYLKELQEKVTEIYGKFVSHVTSNRPITTEKLIEVGAGVFTADKAISLGMADSKMTREDFANYLATIVESKDYNSMNFLNLKPKTKQEDVDMSDKNLSVETQLETLRTELNAKYEADLEAALNKLKEEFTLETSKKDAELAEVRTALELAQKEQKDSKAKLRTEQLTSVIGEASAKKLVETLADISDEKFAETVQVFTLAKQSKDSQFLAETGEEGEEVDPVVADNNKMAAFLQKRYENK